jgi:hypothetical protein
VLHGRALQSGRPHRLEAVRTFSTTSRAACGRHRRRKSASLRVDTDTTSEVRIYEGAPTTWQDSINATRCGRASYVGPSSRPPHASATNADLAATVARLGPIPGPEGMDDGDHEQTADLVTTWPRDTADANGRAYLY